MTAFNRQVWVGITLAVLALAMAAVTSAAEIAGVKIADTARVDGKELVLNGAGVRTRAIFKVYTMALYLGQKESTTAGVLACPGARRVHLVMLRDLTGEEFGQAFMAGISANTDKLEKGRILHQMSKLGEVFVNVGGVKKGDSLTMDWVPGKGTVLELNNKSISEPIADQAFYNATLKIWLGDKPVDQALKPQLLGAPA